MSFGFVIEIVSESFVFSEGVEDGFFNVVGVGVEVYVF